MKYRKEPTGCCRKRQDLGPEAKGGSRGEGTTLEEDRFSPLEQELSQEPVNRHLLLHLHYQIRLLSIFHFVIVR